MSKKIGIRKEKLINELVSHFEVNKELFLRTLDSLNSYIKNSASLNSLIHSTKSRIKDPEHLRDKLMRKLNEANNKKQPFDYNKDNLFSKINDLVGFRILHLNTRQFEKIDIELKKILKEEQWQIIEGPNARTWDDETRDYFKSIKVDTSDNLNMYTSVHYIIKPNKTSQISCEIQVRTLMEEVWGEVDHKINYPHKSDNYSCREQIKVLARVTSSCSRLVDSIFSTHENENKTQKIKSTANKPQKIDAHAFDISNKQKKSTN